MRFHSNNFFFSTFKRLLNEVKNAQKYTAHTYIDAHTKLAHTSDRAQQPRVIFAITTTKTTTKKKNKVNQYEALN